MGGFRVTEGPLQIHAECGTLFISLLRPELQLLLAGEVIGATFIHIASHTESTLKSRADCQCGSKIMSCCDANMRAALQSANAMCASIILGTNCNGCCTCLAKTCWLPQCSKLLLKQLHASAKDSAGAAEALTLFAFGCTAEACFPTLCIPL